MSDRHDTDKIQRTEEYDIDRVKEYLESYPHPSTETMSSFIPKIEEDIDPWFDFIRDTSWDYKINCFKNAGYLSGDIDGVQKVRLMDLYTEHVDQYVELEPCKVVTVSDTESYPTVVQYVCRNCKTEWEVPFTGMLKYPKCYCDKPNVVHDERGDVKLIDSQYVRLQELEVPKGRLRIDLPALLKGRDMMWTIRGNEVITAKGFLRHMLIQSTVKKFPPTYKKWFEVVSIKKVEAAEADVKLTEEDKIKIKEIMEQPLFYEKLLASFAPHLYGMEALKECALIAIASIGMRRPARVLIVSDPAMGKSELLEYASDVAPNAHYVTMSNTRYTGLTTTSQQDKETGRWTVALGVLPAANNGLMCIDEFQVSREEDIKNLNDVIERGKIRFALAGGNFGETDANCALLLACNPHAGKVIAETNIQELLKFMGKGAPAFLSRMNLVMFMKDNATEAEETAIAKHMFKHIDEKIIEKYEQDWKDAKDIEYFGRSTIRKILYYIINNIHPEALPEEFEQELTDYYIRNKSDVVSNVNKLVNRRYMRHVIILSQIFARLKGMTKPLESDIKHVLELLEKNMSTAAFDPKTGLIDANILNDNKPQSEIEQMSKDQQFNEGLELASKMSSDGMFTFNELVDQLNALPTPHWTDRYMIEKELNKWMKGDNAKVFLRANGRYEFI